VDDLLDQHDGAHSHRAAGRMARLGVSLRSLEPERFEEELKAIYQIVTTSFRSGFLYQPLSEAEFLARYEIIRQRVRPELVTISMHEGRLVGFIFTLPDMLQAGLGRPIDTAIVTTLAVLPD